ncbi:hypothetical protein AB0C15_10305 [Micromonospora sp. NPDC048835]|uniref:hypothetical protein n=1 Tax=Micromonospora sp. NPDC048835 TaxID=3155147 RepID=UPI0033FAEE4C
MPPRQHPRSWLAGRLRSAAGAVQRLAGRVEPAGHLPQQPPSATPVATPRRFGEPPQHWLDLVAAHAPGLLHDLALDPSPADNAEDRARGGLPGRVDAVGTDPTVDGRFGSGGSFGVPADPSGTGGAPGRAPDTGGARGTAGRGAVVSGYDAPTRSPVRSRSGRPSQVGDPPGGGEVGDPSRGGEVGDPSGGSARGSTRERVPPAAGPAAATRSAGTTSPAGPGAAVPGVRPAAPAHGTAGHTAAADTSADASRLGRPGGSPPPIRSMVFGSPGPATGQPRRPEAGPSPRPPLGPQRSGDVDHGVRRATDPSPAGPAADRRSAGRDGFRGDSDGPSRLAGDRRDRRDSAPSGDLWSRADAATGPASHGRAARSNPGRRADPWTGWSAVRAEDTAASGRVVDGGPWLALPGEPARLPGASHGTRTTVTDGGRAAGTDAPRPVVPSRGVDPWPALPDDSVLWSVAGAALDTAQSTRLDQEQAGG